MGSLSSNLSVTTAQNNLSVINKKMVRANMAVLLGSHELKLSVSIVPHTKGLFTQETYAGVRIEHLHHSNNHPEIYTLYSKNNTTNKIEPIKLISESIKSGTYYINYGKLKKKGVVKNMENNSDFIEIRLTILSGGTRRNKSRRSRTRKSL